MPPIEDVLPGLWPTLHNLSRTDKLLLIQYLAADLVKDEGVGPLEAGVTYPIWTPHNAFAAANTLLEVLQTERAPT